MAERFEKSTVFDVSAVDLFDWHERDGAFARLNPPWEPVTILEKQGGIQDGALVKLQASGTMWQIRHQNYRHGQQFEDVQVSGPFAKWVHTHQFTPEGDHQTRLTEIIDWALPMHALSSPLVGGWVQNKLDRVFTYRHALTQLDMMSFQQYQDRPRLKIAVSGASGLVGSSLVPFLTTQGHTVLRFVRHPAHAPDEIYWNPVTGDIDAGKLNGVDAVIHLAGENIAAARWTPEQKEKIRLSRVRGTQLISETLAKFENGPKTLVCASAIGFYGNRPDSILTESAAPGNGFLPDVCRAWESATHSASEAGVRVVNMRTGIVLDPRGGALAKMLPVFLAGGGGPLGNGKQIQSWIALEDLVGAFYHALMTPSLCGPVNATSPNPVTNKAFTEALAKVISRPAIAPAPAIALKLLLGEMGQALLLDSSDIRPQKLLDHGYDFKFPEIVSALRFMLGRRL